MVTTRIHIKPHLKEYLSGKYQSPDKYIHFPDRLEIYHTIFNLTEKRPVNCPIDAGNVEIALPYPVSYKQPKTYNYLSAQSQKKIEKIIEIMFWSDFRQYIEFGRNKTGSSFSNLVYEFRKKYGINSISEDALIKHYYRWRKKTRNFKNI